VNKPDRKREGINYFSIKNLNLILKLIFGLHKINLVRGYCLILGINKSFINCID